MNFTELKTLVGNREMEKLWETEKPTLGLSTEGYDTCLRICTWYNFHL